MGVLRVAEDGKTGFFVRQFAAERIDHTDFTGNVSAAQGVRGVEFGEKFVDNDALVKNVHRILVPTDSIVQIAAILTFRVGVRAVLGDSCSISRKTVR